MKIFNKKRVGFTLAEVLVTLGIIGVVAVLTVPNVISSYQKKVYVAQLQKAYNQISNAVALLMIDEEVDNLNDSSLFCNDNDSDYNDCTLNSSEQFLKKYFKIAKDCGDDSENKNCVAEQYKRIDGEAAYIPSSLVSQYAVSLNTGATFIVHPFDTGRPMQVFVDINGKKKPNTYGRDAFYFGVNYRGDIAESFPMESEFNDPVRCAEQQPYSGGCFSKIIDEGWKMDY